MHVTGQPIELGDGYGGGLAGIDQGTGRTLAKGGLRSFEAATRGSRNAHTHSFAQSRGSVGIQRIARRSGESVTDPDFG